MDRRPEQYVPSEAEILALIAARPFIFLIEMVALFWPGLPWRAAPGEDSASEVHRRCWPDGMQRTAARWLSDQLLHLRRRGKIGLPPSRPFLDHLGLTCCCPLSMMGVADRDPDPDEETARVYQAATLASERQAIRRAAVQAEEMFGEDPEPAPAPIVRTSIGPGLEVIEGGPSRCKVLKFTPAPTRKGLGHA